MMSREDTQSACDALIDWLNSQQLNVLDAIPILSNVLGAGIAEVRTIAGPTEMQICFRHVIGMIGAQCGVTVEELDYGHKRS